MRSKSERKRLITYPNINLWPIVLLAFKELWSSIGRTPTPGFKELARGEDVAEPKI